MARPLGKRTVRVVRRSRVDRLSDSPASSATEFDITGCVILPRSSFEEGKGWVTVEGLQVYAPAGADITSSDSVRIDGTLWQVDGAPGRLEDRRARGRATMFYLTQARSS